MRPYYYLGNNLGLTTLSMGYKMLVNTKDLSLGAHVISDGFWAQHIDVFLSKVITKDDRCLDMGCHMGYTTLLMHGLSGNPVNYVDMNRGCVELTRKNLALNGLTGEGHNCAIATRGTLSQASFHMDDTLSGGAIITGLVHDYEAWHLVDYACVIAHPDSLLGNATFVKIDLEGMDWYVMDVIDIKHGIIEHRPADALRHEGTAYTHDSLENCMRRVFEKYHVSIIESSGLGRTVASAEMIMEQEHLDLYVERK